MLELNGIRVRLALDSNAECSRETFCIRAGVFARSLFCAEALHAGTRFFEANDAAVILAKLNDTIGYKLHRQAVLQR